MLQADNPSCTHRTLKDMAAGYDVAKSGPGGTQVQHVDAQRGLTLVTIWARAAESSCDRVRTM